MKASIRVPGVSRIARSGGTIVTWFENAEKFADAGRARAQERDRGRRRSRLEADREEDDLALGLGLRDRQRVERRVDRAHVGAACLRLEQRPAAAGDAQHVAERGEDDVRPLGERDRVVDPPHRDHADRAARAVQVLDLVAGAGLRGRAWRSRACARRRPP